MGTSSSKVPKYEIVDQQASTSETPPRFAGGISPPSQGLVEPSRSQWAPVQQGPAPPLPLGWDFSIDPVSGYPYFFNSQAGVTQWQDPRGPGFGLPQRNGATQLGDRRQIIPPWQGGSADADPLTWPLPPGWIEQHDQATNQRFYVNYDAQIMSYNDPRIEIAKAYAQGPPVQGVPTYYPPPAIGRTQDSSSSEPQLRPPVPFGSPSSSQVYPPPPPRKKHQSMWSKLGYRHGGQPAYNKLLQLGLLGVDGAGRVGSGLWALSSSSSDDSDNENVDEDPTVRTAAAGAFVGQGFGGGNDDESDSSDEQQVSGVGQDEYEGDLNAVEAYGSSSSGSEGNVSTAQGGGGGGSANFTKASSFGDWQAQAKYACLSGWNDIRNSQGKGQKFWMMDRYSKCALVVTILMGLYFGVFEGLFSLLFATVGRLIMSTRTSALVLTQRKRAVRKFKSIARWAFGKGSTLVWAKTRVSSACTRMQVWFYEHVFEHPVVEIRMLTEKDGARPLISALPLQARDITIVTQASADRLPSLEAMASSWGGVMCMAIHVRTEEELQQVYPQLCDLHARIEAQACCRLQVYVAREEGYASDKEAMAALYPVNAMRNLALSMATTELVLILDADFVPSKGLHEALSGDEKYYSELLRMALVERQMLVIPAFEATSGKVEDTYPTTYIELSEQWKSGAATAFHCSHFPRGHKPTNYECFFKPSTCKPYRVQYREFYEPYAICARGVIPLFDARFRGYGMNKISHAYNCAASGMGFTVIPRVFVWSLPHSKSEAWTYTFGATKDPLQKLRILGLYRQFKTEVQAKITGGLDAGVLQVKVEEPPLLHSHSEKEHSARKQFVQVVL